MVSFTALSTLALAVSTALANPIPSHGGSQLYKRSWDYESSIIQGVNLGGWFVLEPYITPSLFQVFSDDESEIPVDEYHYCQTLGNGLCYYRLREHWKSWITEEDFVAMANVGINMVRIPIGYWAFQLLDDDPYVQGQEEYFDQAIEWARQYNISVWVDLHGAPGSQNGFDNSGQRDVIGFQEGNNTQVTLNVLQYIFEKYGTSDYDDVVIGIELLNEPLGPSLDLDALTDFWNTAYWNLRNTGSTQNVIIHDAFEDASYFNDKFLLDEYWGVVIDHHHYQVFSTGELSRGIDDHVSVACDWATTALTDYHWNVAGEWSAALTDCAKWLNGVNRGARWDATYDSSTYFGSCDNSQDINYWSDTDKENHRKYIEAQLDAFEQRGGWIFWCWKTENALEWDMQALIANDIFPQPFSDRKYPNQCGF